MFEDRFAKKKARKISIRRNIVWISIAAKIYKFELSGAQVGSEAKMYLKKISA